MKKIVLLLIIFLGTFFLFTKTSVSQHSQHAVRNILLQKTNPTPSPIPVGLPQTIHIPALQVVAPVETVGLDAQGRMGVPLNDIDTAWYKYGSKPGEKGSAVIDGHFDKVTGAPAVFYNIAKLKNGDTILVTDTFHHTYTFTVTQVTSYPYNQLPMQQIFASTDKARLNLITCDGTWNKLQHNYSNRAVVYSVLQNN